MELTVSGEELTERFVRGDGSRNTEGSGLGLAIARSFTELQHGTMQILLDGDLFKAILTFRKPGAEPIDNRSEHLDTAFCKRQFIWQFKLPRRCRQSCRGYRTTSDLSPKPMEKR